MYVQTIEGAPPSTQKKYIQVPPIGFIREQVVLAIVPWSRSTLWSRVKAGKFPAPLHISARVEDVRDFIAAPEKWEA